MSGLVRLLLFMNEFWVLGFEGFWRFSRGFYGFTVFRILGFRAFGTSELQRLGFKQVLGFEACRASWDFRVHDFRVGRPLTLNPKL